MTSFHYLSVTGWLRGGAASRNAWSMWLQGSALQLRKNYFVDGGRPHASFIAGRSAKRHKKKSPPPKARGRPMGIYRIRTYSLAYNNLLSTKLVTATYFDDVGTSRFISQVDIHLDLTISWHWYSYLT
ncbi:MAG: hypothetical protein AAFQ68_23035 [Bacteroidota bacterium]